jgi:hypothetical protein
MIMGHSNGNSFGASAGNDSRGTDYDRYPVAPWKLGLRASDLRPQDG